MSKVSLIKRTSSIIKSFISIIVVLHSDSRLRSFIMKLKGMRPLSLVIYREYLYSCSSSPQ